MNQRRNYKNYKYIIGIDEAGRGPLAGPVAVGAVCIPTSLSLRRFSGVKDSKQLTPLKRNMWFTHIKKMNEGGFLQYRYSSSTANSVDMYGITSSVHRGVTRVVNYFKVDPEECFVLLDGGLTAPKRYIHQKTIIKGDEKEMVIALASIVAKVLRDKTMIRYGNMYPLYNFGRHKGYGTRAHVVAIKKNGLSPIHRHTFIHF